MSTARLQLRFVARRSAIVDHNDDGGVKRAAVVTIRSARAFKTSPRRSRDRTRLGDKRALGCARRRSARVDERADASLIKAPAEQHDRNLVASRVYTRASERTTLAAQPLRRRRPTDRQRGTVARLLAFAAARHRSEARRRSSRAAFAALRAAYSRPRTLMKRGGRRRASEDERLRKLFVRRARCRAPTSPPSRRRRGRKLLFVTRCLHTRRNAPARPPARPRARARHVRLCGRRSRLYQRALTTVADSQRRERARLSFGPIRARRPLAYRCRFGIVCQRDHTSLRTFNTRRDFAPATLRKKRRAQHANQKNSYDTKRYSKWQKILFVAI